MFINQTKLKLKCEGSKKKLIHSKLIQMASNFVFIVTCSALFFVISNCRPLVDKLSMAAAAVDGMENRVEKRMNWYHYHPQHHHQSQNDDSEKRPDGDQGATEAEQFKSNQ